MNPRHKFLLFAAALTCMSSVGGCATQGYVDGKVGAVDAKVAANGAHLQRSDQKLGETDRTAHEALERAKAAGKLAEGKFLYSVVLSDDSIKFPVARADLSAEAQARLQELVQTLKAENRNVYLEIQGHTDSTGSQEFNRRLGEDRADAVRLFMNRQGVALNRMSTISYGGDAPVAPNTTRTGRAQNRRVVVIVMA